VFLLVILSSLDQSNIKVLEDLFIKNSVNNYTLIVIIQLFDVQLTTANKWHQEVKCVDDFYRLTIYPIFLSHYIIQLISYETQKLRFHCFPNFETTIFIILDQFHIFQNYLFQLFTRHVIVLRMQMRSEQTFQIIHDLVVLIRLFWYFKIVLQMVNQDWMIYLLQIHQLIQFM